MTLENKNMTDSEKLGLYVSKLKERAGLSNEAIGKMCATPESTVKNICNAKTDNPGLFTAAPIIYGLGGSLDEIFTGKSNNKTNDSSYIALKEVYETEINALKEVNEAHIANIRSHYEQHREDVTMNYEKRLADKREIIDMQNTQITKLEETSKSKTKIIFALSAILFVLFFGLISLEVLHPEHGWIRF